MTYMPLCLCASLFALTMHCAHADEVLRQTTITMYAGGKPAGGFIFPIGSAITPSAVANTTEETDNATRYAGNVEGRLRLPSNQSLILFGDDVRVSTAIVSAGRAKAVKDLEAMSGSDQLYRGRVASGVVLSSDEWQRQSAIDIDNTRRLVEIIDQFGWPGLRFAGAASQAAFLVLQHADPDTQRKYLPLLRDAVARNDALGQHLALLEDRVRIADGKPQLYGTQLGGEPLRIFPIEDEASVDQRRSRVGLGPLHEYARSFGVRYMPETPNGSPFTH